MNPLNFILVCLGAFVAFLSLRTLNKGHKSFTNLSSNRLMFYTALIVTLVAMLAMIADGGT